MTPEDRLLALESRVLRASAGPYLDAIEEIRRLLALESPELRAAVLAITAPSMETAVFAGLLDAFDLGIQEALRDHRQADDYQRREESAVRRKAALSGLSPEAVAAAQGLDASAREALGKTLALLNAGVPIEQALAPIFASKNHVELAIITGINRASNDGVENTAKTLGKPMVWESERNACVHCLAYSGQVSVSGSFPPGLTFGKKPLRTDGPPRCPLHPRCRCRLRVLNDPSYAEALRRESIRSVLRGYSLPSESMTARVEAAQRLLDGGVSAPKSVQADARRAIKAGKFPSRVPGGR